MRKKIALVLVSLFTIMTYGQGFKSFKVEGQLFPTFIKNYTDRTSLVDVIVDGKTDLKNVDFKYRLYSQCILVNEISSDFSTSQKTTIDKRGVGEKEWEIRVKPLVPAKLPFYLSFSKQNPFIWATNIVGWATRGVDEKKKTVVRFGNHDVSFIVAFEDDAESVSYDLTPVSKKTVDFAGEFIVEASEDAKEWKTIKTFDENNNFNSSNYYTHKLEKGVRYIRWTYVDRIKLNINLNNISVIPAK